MVKILPSRMTCTYCRVYSNVLLWAPSPRTMAGRKAIPAAVTSRLLKTVSSNPTVNVCLAFALSSAPRLLAIRDEAPVPIILEIAMEIIMTG